MQDVICKEFSPQINKMLVEYAIEKGVPVFKSTAEEKGYPTVNRYIVWCNKKIQRSEKDYSSYRELSVGEFLTFIDELAKPKLTIAGHVVEFSSSEVKVGCHRLSHNEVREFIKEYEKQFGKCS